MGKSSKVDAIALRQAILSYKKAADAVREAQNAYQAVKNKYSSFLNGYFKSRKPKASIDVGGIKYTITQSVRKKITFDPEKLEKAVGKGNGIVHRKYYIDEESINQLVDYLKSCGVSGKVFKSYLSIERQVDEQVLDAAIESGFVRMDDIADCYTIEYGDPYYKVGELDGAIK